MEKTKDIKKIVNALINKEKVRQLIIQGNFIQTNKEQSESSDKRDSFSKYRKSYKFEKKKKNSCNFPRNSCAFYNNQHNEFSDGTSLLTKYLLQDNIPPEEDICKDFESFVRRLKMKNQRSKLLNSPAVDINPKKQFESLNNSISYSNTPLRNKQYTLWNEDRKIVKVSVRKLMNKTTRNTENEASFFSNNDNLSKNPNNEISKIKDLMYNMEKVNNKTLFQTPDEITNDDSFECKLDDVSDFQPRQFSSKRPECKRITPQDLENFELFKKMNETFCPMVHKLKHKLPFSVAYSPIKVVNFKLMSDRLNNMKNEYSK